MKRIFTKDFWVPKTKGDWLCIGLSIGLIIGWLFGAWSYSLVQAKTTIEENEQPSLICFAGYPSSIQPLGIQQQYTIWLEANPNVRILKTETLVNPNPSSYTYTLFIWYVNNED